MRDISVDLTGRRVLVTGGSRGIAAALALAFAENGADVAFSYAKAADELAGKPDAARQLQDAITALGRTAAAIDADLTQAHAAQGVAAAAERMLGPIDTLVLSASVQIHRPFLAMEAADIQRQLQINVMANIEALQAVLPGMRTRGFGRVISIGSVQEVAPSAEMPVYAMTKAALENLVRNLSGENAEYGVTINNIAPGLVETDRSAWRREASMDDWLALTRRANPMRRAGQPEDIVGAALYLASRSASFVTGATLYVAGGAQVVRAGNDPAKPG